MHMTMSHKIIVVKLRIDFFIMKMPVMVILSMRVLVAMCKSSTAMAKNGRH